MKAFLELFDLAAGKALSREEEGTAHRMQLVLRATLATVVFGAIYGIAAGSTDLGLAFQNVYKIPMVVLLSSACALPAGLLTWKLTGAPNRATDLLLGVASANFSATLVLAALAPIVALYYVTSDTFGVVLALMVTALAVVVGMGNLVRAVMNRRPEGKNHLSVLLPLGVLGFAQLAALVQFIFIASPILPERTPFDGGIDEIAGH